MRVLRGLLALVALCGWAVAAEAGNVVVIASTDPSLAAGAVIDGGRPLSVGAKATVTLVTATGKTIKLTGPYQGVPDPGEAGADTALVSSLSRLVTREKAKPTMLAVFRSAPMRRPEGRPDIWGVDIARAGTYCVRPDRPAMLWWSRARPGAVVSFSAAAAGSREVRLRWPRGKRHRVWPTEVALANGGAYVVRFRAGDDGETVVTRMMPELASDAHRAAWMADHGCSRQALKVLEALSNGSL